MPKVPSNVKGQRRNGLDGKPFELKKKLKLRVVKPQVFRPLHHLHKKVGRKLVLPALMLHPPRL